MESPLADRKNGGSQANDAEQPVQKRKRLKKTILEDESDGEAVAPAVCSPAQPSSQNSIDELDEGESEKTFCSGSILNYFGKGAAAAPKPKAYKAPSTKKKSRPSEETAIKPEKSSSGIKRKAADQPKSTEATPVQSKKTKTAEVEGENKPMNTGDDDLQSPENTVADADTDETKAQTSQNSQNPDEMEIDDDECDDEDSDEEPASKKKSKKATKEDGSLLGLNSDYNVMKAVFWKSKKVPYLALARLFEQVEAVSSRLQIICLTSDFFRTLIAVAPDTLIETVYLCCNQIAPAYEGKEMGIGDSVLMRAVSEATGTKMNTLKAKLREIGDLGLVAQASRSTQRTMFPPPPLTIKGVFAELVKLSVMQGNKVIQRKRGLIQKMLVSCRESETKYLIRCLQGKLRIGLQESSVLKALARAFILTPPKSPSNKLDARKYIKREALQKKLDEATQCIVQAYIEVPNHDLVIPRLMDHGYQELEKHCYLTPGIPVKAMLGRPTKGIAELFERFGKSLFTLEFKYDGERAQIHLLPDGTIKIFSRNSEDNTGKYPDIIAKLPKTFDKSVTKNFIIDCEVVAYDVKTKRILPFQTLSTRKRKGVQAEDVQVQVCLFAFDMMCLNGQSFMRKDFAFRREHLHKTFKEVEGELYFARYKDTNDEEEVKEFLDLSVKESCEGLMVKKLHDDAFYVPNKRNWLKVKKDYLDGVTDTLDLVPIGAYYGKGKRTGTFGAYLLACYDDETEEYQSITKIGTGFSDEDLTSHTKQLKDHIIESCPKYYRYDQSKAPDVFFEPAIVWEVLAADLSLSPVYKAAVGMADPAKGISLRFPRFVRIRTDKPPEECTSAEQVVDMYRNQSVIK